MLKKEMIQKMLIDIIEDIWDDYKDKNFEDSSDLSFKTYLLEMIKLMK